MRLGLALVALLGACQFHMYDPVEEIAFREFPDTKSAITSLLVEAGAAKVYAVGEYHATRSTKVDKSPLARFTTDVLDLMIPHSRHLVIETWLDDGCQPSQQVKKEVQKETGRPPSTSTDIEALVMKSVKKKLVTHGLAMTCTEHGSLLDAMGRVDFLRLLELVTEKLGNTAKHLATTPASTDRAVIVYGGALHNDLYPRWQLETLSYAEKLNGELGGGVVEIDLVVPEVIAPMTMVRSEPWFPLIGRASPDRVMVWKRGPTSFVVILPAQSEEVAKIARPVHRG
ncbi:MAG: hypothetical protein ACKV2T_03065 [Kofleriaceae bacterium]